MKYYTFTLSQKRVRVRVSVLDASFNNISVILWQSVLALEETGVPRENH
jgi:exosome complex RNA-binding protein Rrp42 (RNase PH superfamily)